MTPIESETGVFTARVEAAAKYALIATVAKWVGGLITLAAPLVLGYYFTRAPELPAAPPVAPAVVERPE